MDPFTHVLLGVTTSEVSLRRRVGRSANWLAAIAAASPDLDTLASRFSHDPWIGLTFHRSITHAFVMAPVIAAVWAGLFWLFRRRQFGAMWLLATIAVVSHPLLDMVTSYGTEVFWPFSHARVAFDVLPIVNMFFTPILLVTVVCCWLARRAARRTQESPPRSAEAKPSSAEAARPGHFSEPGFPRRDIAWRIAVAGLTIALLYAAAGEWMNVRSDGLAVETVPTTHGPLTAVRAGPLIGNIFARRIVARTPKGFYVARYNLLTSQGRPFWHWADRRPAARRSPGPANCRTSPPSAGSPWAWPTRWSTTPTTATRATRGWSTTTCGTGYPADATTSLFWAEVVFGPDGQVVYGPAQGAMD